MNIYICIYIYVYKNIYHLFYNNNVMTRKKSAILKISNKKRPVHISVADMREAFDLFDRDKDGFIQASELGAVMRSLGISFQPQDLRNMIQNADPRGKYTFLLPTSQSCFPECCYQRDWSLIMGRRATKWENRESETFCVPPSRQGKTFCAPF